VQCQKLKATRGAVKQLTGKDGDNMDLPIATATSNDVSKRFGFWFRKASTSAIAIERGGTAHVVMLPAAEYQRLMRLDHAALAPGELTDEAVRSLVAAKAPPLAFRRNKLLD